MADTKPKSSGKASGSEPRSEKEIEADLAVRRDRLARTVDELAYRTSPSRLKSLAADKVEGTVSQAKGAVEQAKSAATDRARAAAFDEEGGVRLDQVSIVLASVAGVAITLGLARRTFYRG